MKPWVACLLKASDIWADPVSGLCSCFVWRPQGGLLVHLVHTCSNTPTVWFISREGKVLIVWDESAARSSAAISYAGCGFGVTLLSHKDETSPSSELRGFVRVQPEEGRIKCSRWHCDSGSDCWAQHIVPRTGCLLFSDANLCSADAPERSSYRLPSSRNNGPPVDFEEANLFLQILFCSCSSLIKLCSNDLFKAPVRSFLKQTESLSPVKVNKVTGCESTFCFHKKRQRVWFCGTM